jgi:hypothetical protein
MVRTDVVAYLGIGLSDSASKSKGKFYVVVRSGTAEAGKTAAQSAEGSLVYWDKLNIAM